MKLSSVLALALIMLLGSCKKKETAAPDGENAEEEINSVELKFSAGEGPSNQVAVVFAGDFEIGSKAISKIVLKPNTTYTLAIDLQNTNGATDEEKNVTAEVEEEADEHQFFFAFTEGLFANPTGKGNIAPEEGTINYKDLDGSESIKLGLKTEWTTGAEAKTGTFRVVLKHQPKGLKTATSTSEAGTSDVDLIWDIEVEAPTS